MTITPQFVEALRSAALTFQISQPIRHIDAARAQFGTLMLLAYDGPIYAIEDAKTGRRLLEASARFPLAAITAAMEYYRYDRPEDAIIAPDPRQLSFDI